ncbi:hypothetical protein [Bradyrhizobium stylosanthis]|uniref:Uncharacterized protein n=1 Tax=Bradyrhizobium stylosanthis TaxID=1803665 RepID=A0A560CXK6_9BRAD|nr:hypothetical protein [Bradyrhizobium stylosanthis]TWA89585.1 hypothetical protein FBZ96_11953 [Bradyrhizobium stylosanthis]
MCDPITLAVASTAASAGGSLLSANEANENAQNVAAARNRATLAELERQKAYGAQARGEFDKSLNLFGPGAQEASLSKAQGDVGSLLTHNTPDAASVGTITTANAPAAVRAGESKKLGDVFSYLGDSAKNLGNLKGYDQNTFNTNQAVTANNRNIGVITDNSKVSADVNKMEQNAAATNAYTPPSGMGDLLSFAGNMGSYYAGGGKLGLPKFSGSTTIPGLNPGGPYV